MKRGSVRERGSCAWGTTTPTSWLRKLFYFTPAGPPLKRKTCGSCRCTPSPHSRGCRRARPSR
eukprot:112086-Pyramimonas_sp.AAC.1